MMMMMMMIIIIIYLFFFSNRKCFILDLELSKDGFKLGSKITAVNSNF